LSDEDPVSLLEVYVGREMWERVDSEVEVVSFVVECPAELVILDLDREVKEGSFSRGLVFHLQEEVGVIDLLAESSEFAMVVQGKKVVDVAKAELERPQQLDDRLASRWVCSLSLRHLLVDPGTLLGM
jgi:hypothetical protein